jgi:hypothetical protein
MEEDIMEPCRKWVTRHKAEQEDVRRNLFYGAGRAVEPWERFPWHRDVDHRLSSQALAIDMFGTIKMSPERNEVLNEIAAKLGLAPSKDWDLCLEWCDPHNPLNERRQTQVDAVARSDRSLMFFECKLKEDGGRCSQASTGQCDGNYRTGRCELTRKGIRYWEVIPSVFTCPSSVDHQPCPFSGPWFQLMRNVTLCHRVAQAEQPPLRPAFVVAYADHPALPMARQVSSPKSKWAEFTAKVNPEVITVGALRYQDIIRLAQMACRQAKRDTRMWDDLEGWVNGKIEDAARAMTAGRR